MAYLSGLLNKRVDSAHLCSMPASTRGPAPLPQVEIRLPEVNRRPVSLRGVLSDAGPGAGTTTIHAIRVAPATLPQVDCRVPKIELKLPPRPK
jgi:hypothetical protein